MWIDRYYYELHHPEAPKNYDGILCIGFCPEGYYRVGDIIKNGEWTKTIVKIVPRIKKANTYLENIWKERFEDEDSS